MTTAAADKAYWYLDNDAFHLFKRFKEGKEALQLQLDKNETQRLSQMHELPAAIAALDPIADRNTINFFRQQAEILAKIVDADKFEETIKIPINQGLKEMRDYAVKIYGNITLGLRKFDESSQSQSA